MVKGSLDALLNVLSKSGLDELGDFLAKDSVAVTDREEMCSSVLAKMRQHQVGVLVDLVRVLRTVTCLRGEGEFSDTVVELLHARLGLSWSRQGLGSGDFSSDRGPNCIAISALCALSHIALLFMDVCSRLTVFRWHSCLLLVLHLPSNFSNLS